MGDLQYPLQFANNMPWIHFEAFKYAFPAPKESILDLLNKKEPLGEKISLYMPNDFTESANATWSLEDTYRSQGNWGSLGVAGLTAAVNKVDPKSVSTTKVSTGTLPFPTDISVFQQISPLGFTLNFKLIPFDSAEGNAIVQIAQKFKNLQVPKISDSSKNMVLKFPAIWDINFRGINGLAYTNSTYQNMALTHCSVNYVSGTESASVFHDKNPTQINLSLSFEGIQKFFMAE